jgi:hypothetical protein
MQENASTRLGLPFHQQISPLFKQMCTRPVQKVPDLIFFRGNYLSTGRVLW